MNILVCRSLVRVVVKIVLASGYHVSLLCVCVCKCTYIYINIYIYMYMYIKYMYI